MTTDPRTAPEDTDVERVQEREERATARQDDDQRGSDVPEEAPPEPFSGSEH